MSTPATTLSADGTARPRRRVPRWVWFVVVCMVLGVMTSVGVAWGIASFDPPGALAPLENGEGPANVSRPEGEVTWVVTRSSRRGWVNNWFHTNWPRRGIGLSKYMVDEGRRHFVQFTSDPISRAAMERHAPLANTAHATVMKFTVFHTGWPALCLGAESTCNRKYLERIPRGWYGNVPPGASVDAGFNFASHYNAFEIGEHLLPLGPLWPGLLANTAFYGGAWAVLIGVPILLRRWLRARRGGCPQCGYSREGLKVDAPCPECGRAAAAAHDATTTPAAPTAR